MSSSDLHDSGHGHPETGRFGPPDPDGWAEGAFAAKALVPGLLVICGGLIGADLLYHKHGHYDFEQWVGFHGFYGFASFVFLVLVSTQMRKLVQSRADLYRSEEGGFVTPLPLSRFPEDAHAPAAGANPDSGQGHGHGHDHGHGGSHE